MEEVASHAEPEQAEYAALDLGLDEAASEQEASAAEEQKGDDSPGDEEKAETESDHYMEMYVEGQLKEKFDPLQEAVEKVQEEIKSI